MNQPGYLDGKLDEITRAARAGDADEVMRQLGHLRAEAGQETADLVTRKLIELDFPRRKPQLWLVAAIGAVVGAAIAVAVTIPATRLSTIAATTVTATVSVPSSVPPPIVPTSGPVSSFGPPPPTGGPTTGTPTTAAAAATAPEVYSSGSVTVAMSNPWGVVVRDEGNWSMGAYPDLFVTNEILSPGSSASIFRMDRQPPSYEQCRAAGTGGPYPLSQVPSGTFVCVKTRDGRVGYALLDYKPNRDGKIEEVLLTGQVWRSR